MKRSLLLIGLLIRATPGLAESSSQPLTWRDCVRLAATSNPQLLSAIQAQEASQAQYNGSYNGILPQVDLTHSYSKNSSSHDALLADGTATTLTTHSTSWQLQGTARLDLIDFGQWANIQSAAATLRQAQANENLTSSNVLLNLYNAFSGLLYAQDEIDVASRIRDLLNTNAQINLRYDSGSESKGNAMQTQAQYLQADLGLNQAKRSLRVAQQQLGQVLGKDHFTVLVVTGTWSAEPTSSDPPDFETLIDRLPSVRVQQALVDQAKAAVNSARSLLLPTLSVNYSRGLDGATEFPNNPYWTFTGLINYPLFSGGLTSTYYATSSAKRNYEKALQDMRATRQQARIALENAWSSFAQAQDQVKIQAAFLSAATQRKQESDITYQSGLLSYQDWQTVTTDFVNFQKSYLSAEQTLVSAEGQWHFATGHQLGE